MSVVSSTEGRFAAKPEGDWVKRNEPRKTTTETNTKRNKIAGEQTNKQRDRQTPQTVSLKKITNKTVSLFGARCCVSSVCNGHMSKGPLVLYIQNVKSPLMFLKLHVKTSIGVLHATYPNVPKCSKCYMSKCPEVFYMLHVQMSLTVLHATRPNAPKFSTSYMSKCPKVLYMLHVQMSLCVLQATCPNVPKCSTCYISKCP